VLIGSWHVLVESWFVLVGSWFVLVGSWLVFVGAWLVLVWAWLGLFKAKGCSGDKDLLAQNQDNVSDWSDMSTRGLLF
jgi:hypothetical protein